jgi:hypothetical protein
VIGRAAVAGKECGNGLVIEHAGGWSTQYCHMMKGSILPKPGAQVASGQPLGKVGLSGDTEFPHLHLTVRLNGSLVDPFAFGEPSDACDGGTSLWAKELSAVELYRPRDVLNTGFAGAPMTMELIESGEVRQHAASASSEALVAYVRTIGLRAGDVQRLAITGPDGGVFADSSTPALETNKAQVFLTVGKRRKDLAWPLGIYKASYVVSSGGAKVLQQDFEIVIKN